MYEVLVQKFKYKHFNSYVEGTGEAPMTEVCWDLANDCSTGRNTLGELLLEIIRTRLERERERWGASRRLLSQREESQIPAAR